MTIVMRKSVIVLMSMANISEIGANTYLGFVLIREGSLPNALLASALAVELLVMSISRNALFVKLPINAHTPLQSRPI